MDASTVVVKPLRAEHLTECYQYLDQVNALLAQLSDQKAFEAPYALKSFLDQATLFLAFDGEKVVGALTLFVLRKPTGQFGMIEDVIVDEAHRGKGIEESLKQAATRAAVEAGADHIYQLPFDIQYKLFLP